MYFNKTKTINNQGNISPGRVVIKSTFYKIVYDIKAMDLTHAPWLPLAVIYQEAATWEVLVHAL